MERGDLMGGEAGIVPVHPIGVVSRRTGLSPHVLRAWERRYGVVEPVRTAGGRRLYSEADVRRLRLLRQATEAGRSIARVAELTDGELTALAAEDRRNAASEVGAAADAESCVAACLAAAEGLDGEAVQGALMRAVVAFRPGEFLDRVLFPLLREVGERWHAGRIGPAHEHVVSVAARRVLGWLLQAYEAPSGAPVLVATTPSSELHEFGAMVACVVALEEGWRVLYLGPSLPAGEIARAARQVAASVVAVSVVTARGDGPAVHEASGLRRILPADVALVAGGAGAAAGRAELEAAGWEVVTELEAWREVLGAAARREKSR